MSFDAVQEASGLEPNVLASVMNYLRSQEMVDEPAQGRYTVTRLTPYMATPLFVDAVLH